MIIFVFFNFLAFWPFPWQRQPFWKNQPLTAQLHMAYDIPTRFHKVWSRHLREIERTKMCGRIIIIITRFPLQSNSDITQPHYFGTSVSMVTPFWILSTRQKFPHTTVNIPTMFHEVWWKESKFFLNPLFLISMATAAKFVQPIPIFLAYLVLLDVNIGNCNAERYRCPPNEQCKY